MTLQGGIFTWIYSPELNRKDGLLLEDTSWCFKETWAEAQTVPAVGTAAEIRLRPLPAQSHNGKICQQESYRGPLFPLALLFYVRRVINVCVCGDIPGTPRRSPSPSWWRLPRQTRARVNGLDAREKTSTPSRLLLTLHLLLLSNLVPCNPLMQCNYYRITEAILLITYYITFL